MKRTIAKLGDPTFPASSNPTRDVMYRALWHGFKLGFEIAQRTRTAGRPKGSAKVLAPASDENLRRYAFVERRLMSGMKKTMAAKDLAKKDSRSWRTIVRHYDAASKQLHTAGLRAGVDVALLFERLRQTRVQAEQLPEELRHLYLNSTFALPQEPAAKRRRVVK